MAKLAGKNGREITPGSVLWCDDGYISVLAYPND